MSCWGSHRPTFLYVITNNNSALPSNICELFSAQVIDISVVTFLNIEDNCRNHTN